MEVILILHCFLYAQLKDVGEIAGGIKPKIHYRISNAEGEYKGEKTLLACVKYTFVRPIHSITQGINKSSIINWLN